MHFRNSDIEISDFKKVFKKSCARPNGRGVPAWNTHDDVIMIEIYSSPGQKFLY